MKPILLTSLLLLSGTAFASPKISAQSIIVNPTQPDLSVSVAVNKDTTGNANPTYRIGEPMTITTTVSRDAYVYLFNVNPDGTVDQILPNRLSESNFVKAGTPRVFPNAQDNFKFNVGGPIGLNKVLALASLTELNLNDITTFKKSQDQFATFNTRGQDKLAQALSIVVTPLPQNSWVSDTVFYTVTDVKPIATGSLYVGTNLVGSTVILNGRTLGPANLTYPNIRPGTYPIRVSAPGAQDFRSTVTIRSNATTNLNVQFVQRVVALPSNPKVTLKTSVAGARVFLDGNELGTVQNGALTMEVTPGTHEIMVVASGYRTFVQNYTISKDTTLTITPTR